MIKATSALGSKSNAIDTADFLLPCSRIRGERYLNLCALLCYFCRPCLLDGRYRDQHFERIKARPPSGMNRARQIFENVTVTLTE